jgi:hypothetical protein
LVIQTLLLAALVHDNEIVVLHYVVVAPWTFKTIKDSMVGLALGICAILLVIRCRGRGWSSERLATLLGLDLLMDEIKVSEIFRATKPVPVSKSARHPHHYPIKHSRLVSPRLNLNHLPILQHRRTSPMFPMRPHIPLIIKVMTPHATAFRTIVASEVEDLGARTVIEVDALGWLYEGAVHGLGCVTAVELPGWVAGGYETGGFEDADVWVAVAVGGTPDLALGFAVTDGRSLRCNLR